MSTTSEWATVLVEGRRVAADIAGLLGVEVDAATILTGRAAIMNLARPGRISAGGATRLLRTVDGWCAVALPRDDDVAALPALMEVGAFTGDPWTVLSRWVATRSTDEVVERASLLDIAVAALGETAAEPPTVRRCGTSTGPRRADGLLVADLSSLWAGPLCGQLLARAGGLQPGERVRDCVAEEHRPVGASADQSAGDRGVIPERGSVGLVAMAVDTQPDSAGLPGQLLGAQSATSQRRGP